MTIQTNIRINIIVEGQTEETFVNDVLQAHLQERNIIITPQLIKTSKHGRGGVTSYEKIKNHISRRCVEDTKAFVTSMFDTYKLPTNFPGYKGSKKYNNPCERAIWLENKFAENINQCNFIPYLQSYEFEAILFSDVSKFENIPELSQNAIQELEEIKKNKKFETPEHINDTNPPSKRISNIFSKNYSSYDKPLHGTLISKAIGIDRIRSECKHFDQWVTTLENLNKNP